MQTKNFIVYKSSAGSGKTFTLVKEYLKIALADKQNLKFAYKKILAVTFTNKAAAEMKWRIIKALKDISNKQNDFLTNLIATELTITEADLQQRSQATLTQILHNYSDFSIGTIDSFTHRIIRTFALDLKLPLNFKIETDTNTIFNKVIALLVQKIGTDKLITDYFIKYSQLQIEDNRDWNLEKSLFEFIKEINKEGVSDLVNKLEDFTINDFETIKKQLLLFIKEYKNYFKLQGTQALQIIATNGLTDKAFWHAKAGIYNLFNKLVVGNEILKDELFTSRINETLEEDKWHGSKLTPTEFAILETIKPELQKVIDNVLAKINESEKRYNVYSLIYKNIYAIGLVNELAKLTNEYKTDENILFLSEFNQRISNVVSNEPTPFIFERLGDKYQHFLLDEFQDTSAMQWQNMLPLVDNSLGSAKLNLIVGDGKQSIYRWRNANVEQFVNLPNIKTDNKTSIIAQREESLIRNYSPQILNTNFRSDSVIVNFNNTIFEHLSQNYLNTDFQKIYDNQTQKHNQLGKGFVSIDFPEQVKDDEVDVNLKLTKHYIQQALTDGYDYADVCVIVRTNGNGNSIANFLIEQKIPVISADSLLLSNALEITVLKSFLKYISNNNDLISASVVVNYLYQTNYCNQHNYIENLQLLNKKRVTNLFTIINKCGITCDEVKLNASNLFDTCVYVCDILNLNKNNPQYIRFFLDEVLTFLQTNTSNINLFLDWWQRKQEKASVIIPEGINAVNIMTVHASKGLEFPIVISPYVNSATEKPQSIWVNVDEEELNLPVAIIPTSKMAELTIYEPLVVKEKQQQALDNINVLYVNFTRAVNRLHIISPKPTKIAEKNSYTWLQHFALTQAHYNTEANTLTFGNFEVKDRTQHQKKALTQINVPNLNFNLNQSVVKIKGASQYNYNEDVEQARQYGILIHFILSQITDKQNIASVVQKTLLNGDINAQEAEQLEVEITSLLNIPTITNYFKPGVVVKNEMEILTSDGQILRPDRVVIIDTEAIVIDYKTGKKQAQKHYQQMQEYEHALLNLGYQSVKKIVLYIHDKEVVVV